MKLALVEYGCGNCQKRYHAGELGPHVYGEFLLRSGSGEVRYLDANADRIFDEVNELISGSPQLLGVGDYGRAAIFSKLFGALACDASEDGTPFAMKGSPACPNCGKCTPKTWVFVDPPEFIEVTIASVTHDLWSSLSAEQKQARLNGMLQSLSPALLMGATSR